MDPILTEAFDRLFSRLSLDRVPPALPGYRAVRFTGLPSFHAEVCLDAAEGPEGTFLVLRAVAGRVGYSGPPIQQAEHLPTVEAAALWCELETGVSRLDLQTEPEHGIDGMPVQFDYVDAVGRRIGRSGWSPHPDLDGTLFRVVWPLVQAAHRNLEDAKSRLVIRDLAGYLTPVCAACLQPLVESERVVRLHLPGLPPEHPAAELSRSQFHLDCFVKSPNRGALAALAREHMRFCEDRSTHYATVHDETHLVLSVMKVRGEFHVEIAFPNLVTTVEVAVDGWPQPLLDLAVATDKLHPLEQEALKDGLARLLAALPDGRALRRAFEQRKAGARKREGERKRDERRALEDRIRRQRQACDRLIEQIRAGALTCPHCARSSSDYRFMDSGPRKRPYFICRRCGGSLRPEDLDP